MEGLGQLEQELNQMRERRRRMKESAPLSKETRELMQDVQSVAQNQLKYLSSINTLFERISEGATKLEECFKNQNKNSTIVLPSPQAAENFKKLLNGALVAHEVVAKMVKKDEVVEEIDVSGHLAVLGRLEEADAHNEEFARNTKEILQGYTEKMEKPGGDCKSESIFDECIVQTSMLKEEEVIYEPEALWDCSITTFRSEEMDASSPI